MMRKKTCLNLFEGLNRAGLELDLPAMQVLQVVVGRAASRQKQCAKSLNHGEVAVS